MELRLYLLALGFILGYLIRNIVLWVDLSSSEERQIRIAKKIARYERNKSND